MAKQAVESLGRSVLEFVARYLDVAVAALYVREDNGNLRRVAAYGFSRDNEKAGQSFHSGEGLAGQAALENRVLQLSDLPDSYLKITSGLGQGSASHALVVPVHNDGQVNGVVELGFLRPLGPRDLEFVNMIANNIERLLDEVTLFLHKVESGLSAERQTLLKIARNQDRVFEGRKILLVDDDVRNIFALTSALEHKGLLVEIGRDGFEAISKLDDVSDIDLVLMDVMMPGMDGLEATRRIRQNPRFQKLPIIAVTAKAMKDDQEQCLEAGTNDYLAKPIDLERLYALLRVWMPRMERS